MPKTATGSLRACDVRRTRWSISLRPKIALPLHAALSAECDGKWKTNTSRSDHWCREMESTPIFSVFLMAMEVNAVRNSFMLTLPQPSAKGVFLSFTRFFVWLSLFWWPYTRLLLRVDHTPNRVNTGAYLQVTYITLLRPSGFFFSELNNAWQLLLNYMHAHFSLEVAPCTRTPFLAYNSLAVDTTIIAQEIHPTGPCCLPILLLT